MVGKPATFMKSVVLPVLLFPLSVAGATYLAMPTQYMSTATVVLTTSTNGGMLSQDPTHPPEINPLRNFDGMKTAASILIQVLNTPDVANRLGAVTGGAATFTVSDGSTIPQLLGSNGPFIVIEGDSTSATAARDIVVRVEQRLRDELNNQQRALNAPPSTFLGIIDVVPPSAAEAQISTKLKAGAGALVLGLIASMGVAYFIHRIRASAFPGTSATDTVTARRVEAPTPPAVLRSSVGPETHRQ